MPSDVMQLDDMDVEALERAFAVNYSPTIALELARRKAGEKALPDIESPALWAALRKAIMPSITAMFRDAFARGARLAVTQARAGRKHYPEAHDQSEHGNWATGGDGGDLLGDEFVVPEFPSRGAVMVRPDGAYLRAPDGEEHMTFARTLDSREPLDSTAWGRVTRERGFIPVRAGLFSKNDLIVTIYKEPTAAQMRAIERASEGRSIQFSMQHGSSGEYASVRGADFNALRAAVAHVFGGKPESLVAKYRDDALAIMSGQRAAPRTINPARVERAAQQAIADYSDAWWEQFSTNTQERMRAVLAAAESEGLTIDEIVDGLAPLFGEDRAQLIAVTETTRLMGMGATETYRALGFGGWEWQTANDELVCPICSALDGQEFSTDDVFQPGHPGCLTGDALVAAGGDVSGVTKRVYEGDLIVISTAGGKRLSVTPNHPILTPEGWLAAELVQRGSDLVVVDGASGEDDREHMPARIEQIADAAFVRGALGTVDVPVSAEDFHGDGGGSKVAVIYTDGLLRHRLDAAHMQRHGQRPLILGDIGLQALHAERVATLAIHSADAPARSVVRAGDLPSPPLGSHARPFDPLLLGSGAHGDGGASEEGGDRRPADTARLGESVHRFAIGVALDHVTRIERMPYIGHVYNLETSQGWFVANGIVTHNCRCWATPAGDPGDEGDYATLEDALADLTA